ncbi:MAG: hypothetical protein HY553_20720 [Elusimicrobia bacterium]|nr:hypothetical protein [Elusimicrobiota bacterium]
MTGARLAALIGLALWAAPAAAAVVRVQGQLTDSEGRPYTGKARLDFRLFDASARRELWSEPLEVDAVKGVFVAFLGLGASRPALEIQSATFGGLAVRETAGAEPLPDPGRVRPSWRLVAEPALGSRLAVGSLSEPAEDLRRAELARLMIRLGLPATEKRFQNPAEYRRLLSGSFAGFAPPDTVSTAPECAETADLDGTCPKPLRRVLGREERLLRERLLRVSRSGAPSRF